MISKPATAVEWDTLLGEVEASCRGLTEGDVARYIPALATVDPDQYALAICTIGGEVFVAGDADRTFTLQSISKPFLYGTALQRLGSRVVRTGVGVEPTGEPFDSFVRLERGRHRPHNPMVNAGAITITSLLARAAREPAMHAVPNVFGPYAGRALRIDDAAYRSESETADRNRAIAHLLAYFGRLATPVEEALEFYFRSCALLVCVADVAVMGAVLAAGGRHPVTGSRVLHRRCVRDVLRVMTSCGMYDGSGRFAFEVGVPAKSGVSGGVLGVVPGALAVSAFSPRLDAQGNSVRGFAALRMVAERTGSHMFLRHRRKPRLPSPGALDEILRKLLTGRAGHAGRVADYCPELAAADPDRLAIAVCDAAGGEVAVGDAEHRFSLQACANPFVYGLALAEHGVAHVHARVGMEPSGNPFDAIPFDPTSRQPHNPLGNAGAITVQSLLSHNPDQIGTLLAPFAGRDRLAIDAAVLRSERATGGRNRAIAYQLKNFGVIDDVEPALERYFHQCALVVSAPLAARMAATLACGGVNPVSGRRAIPQDLVRPILTLMYTCGLHDYSGRFAFEVGLPAKSGISGGMVAVVPGRLGIAVFSPRVDRYGASVRGVRVLRRVSRAFGWGVFAG